MKVNRRTKSGRPVSKEAAELRAMLDANRRGESGYQYVNREPHTDRRRSNRQRRLERLRRRRRVLHVKNGGSIVLFYCADHPDPQPFLLKSCKKRSDGRSRNDGSESRGFPEKEGVKIEFVTDMAGIDMNHVGEHEIVLKAKEKSVLLR